MSARDWETAAACREIGGELWHSRDPHDREAATWVCRTRCAVRQECLEAALERREPSGIWGGLSTRQRHLLAEQRQQTIPQPQPAG